MTASRVILVEFFGYRIPDEESPETVFGPCGTELYLNDREANAICLLELAKGFSIEAEELAIKAGEFANAKDPEVKVRPSKPFLDMNLQFSITSHKTNSTTYWSPLDMIEIALKAGWQDWRKFKREIA